MHKFWWRSRSRRGPFGKWAFLICFWAAVFSALLGVWQSLPYLFTDLLWLRAGSGIAQRGEVDVSRSVPYRAYLAFLATVPLFPLLALTLLVMNNRREWVGVAFRT